MAYTVRTRPAVQFKSGLTLWFLNGKAVTEQDVLAYRQEIEREALELSDKLKSKYDITLDHDITVGHATRLKKASD